MKRFHVGIAILLGLLIWPAVTLLRSDEPEEQKTECCFDNPSYQGTCEVTPADGETCESILEYLNTAGTAGKTYCGNSKIRGGWIKAECPSPSGAAQLSAKPR